MKNSLYKYIKNILEDGGAVTGTPGNTLGMGNPMAPTDAIPGSEPLLPTAKSKKEHIYKKKTKKVKESLLDDDDDSIIARADKVTFNMLFDQIKGYFSTKCTLEYSVQTGILDITSLERYNPDVEIEDFNKVQDVFKKYSLPLKKLVCSHDLLFTSGSIKNIDICVLKSVTFQEVISVENVGFDASDSGRYIYLYDVYHINHKPTVFSNIKKLNRRKKLTFSATDLCPVFKNCSDIDHFRIRQPAVGRTKNPALIQFLYKNFIPSNLNMDRPIMGLDDFLELVKIYGDSLKFSPENLWDFSKESIWDWLGIGDSGIIDIRLITTSGGRIWDVRIIGDSTKTETVIVKDFV